MLSCLLVEKAECRELIKKSINMQAFVVVHPHCQLDWMRDA